VSCSFCGREGGEDRRLVVADSGVAICAECLRAAGQLVDKDDSEGSPAAPEPDS
jgi:ATP-dependent protease Clp ATPase subunit